MPPPLYCTVFVMFKLTGLEWNMLLGNTVGQPGVICSKFKKWSQGGWLQYILLRNGRLFKVKYSVVALSFRLQWRTAPVHVHPPSLHFLQWWPRQPFAIHRPRS